MLFCRQHDLVHTALHGSQVQQDLGQQLIGQQLIGQQLIAIESNKIHMQIRAYVQFKEMHAQYFAPPVHLHHHLDSAHIVRGFTGLAHPFPAYSNAAEQNTGNLLMFCDDVCKLAALVCKQA